MWSWGRGRLSKASVRFKWQAQHSGVVVTGEESGRGRTEQMSKELKAGSGVTTLHQAQEFWASTTRGWEKNDLSSWPPPVGLSPAPTKEHFEFWGAKGLGQLPKKKHMGPAADIQVRWLFDLGSESFYGVRTWSRLLDNQELLLLSLSCTHCGLMIQGHPDKPAAHWGSQPSHPPRWQPLWLNVFNASKRRNCYCCCVGREIVWGAGTASLQINRVMLCPALHLITLLLMKSSGKSSGWQFVAETLFSNRAKENLG